MSQGGATLEHHTSTGLPSRKMLMWAFIGSETMFFGSLITTYISGPQPAGSLSAS